METMAHWQQVSLSLPRCSYLFLLQRPRTLVQQDPHSSKQLFPRKCTPIYRKARRAARRDPLSRLHVGLPPIKLLLRLTEHLLAQHMFSVETMFPSQVLGAVQVYNSS